jgi:hypothetical protein
MNSSEKKPSASADIPLLQQRFLLRQQLASQRQVIERQLGPVPAERSQAYPRSNTMRFFMQRPELMKKLLGQLTGLVIGASFVKSMHPLLAITKFLHSSFSSRR